MQGTLQAVSALCNLNGVHYILGAVGHGGGED